MVDVFTKYLNAALFVLCAIATLVLVIIHGVQSYQDLYTKDRKSVQNRRKSATLTKRYKYTTWFTFLSCLFYLTLSISTAINYTVSFNYHICIAANYVAFASFNLGKGFMYAVFLIRLVMIYGGTHYGYSMSCLGCLCATTVVVTGTLIVFGYLAYVNETWADWEESFFLDEDFPHTCDEIFDESNIVPTVIALVSTGFDLFMNIIYFFLFFIPLRKAIKEVAPALESSVTASGSTTQPTESSKLVSVAMKVGILTATLCISSFLVLFMLFATGIAGLFGIDWFINVICLMLMSPYYKDKVWYNKICKLCILCCDKKGYSTFKYDPNREAKVRSTSGSTEASTNKSDIMTDLVEPQSPSG